MWTLSAEVALEAVRFVSALAGVVGGICCLAAVFRYNWKAHPLGSASFRIGWPWNAPGVEEREQKLWKLGFPLLLLGNVMWLLG